MASLKGVVDFIRQHKQDSFHVAPAMIQVQGYNKVAVFSDIQKSGQRVKFCSAECQGVTESNFKFGAYKYQQKRPGVYRHTGRQCEDGLKQPHYKYMEFGLRERNPGNACAPAGDCVYRRDTTNAPFIL